MIRSQLESGTVNDFITTSVSSAASDTTAESGIISDIISSQISTKRNSKDSSLVNEFIMFSVSKAYSETLSDSISSNDFIPTVSTGIIFSETVSDSILTSDFNSKNIIQGIIPPPTLPPTPPPVTATSLAKKSGSGSTGIGPSTSPTSPSPPSSSSDGSSSSSGSSNGAKSENKQDDTKDITIDKFQQTPDVVEKITLDPEPVSITQPGSDLTKRHDAGFNILDNPQAVMTIFAAVTISTVVSILILILRKGLIWFNHFLIISLKIKNQIIYSQSINFEQTPSFII